MEWLLVNHAEVLTLLGRFEQAEALLLEAEVRLADPSVPIKNDGEFNKCIRAVTEAFVELFDAWHAAAPDTGHEVKAAEWRARLEEARAAAARFEPPFEPPADNDG